MGRPSDELFGSGAFNFGSEPDEVIAQAPPAPVTSVPSSELVRREEPTNELSLMPGKDYMYVPQGDGTEKLYYSDEKKHLAPYSPLPLVRTIDNRPAAVNHGSFHYDFVGDTHVVKSYSVSHGQAPAHVQHLLGGSPQHAESTMTENSQVVPSTAVVTQPAVTAPAERKSLFSRNAQEDTSEIAPAAEDNTPLARTAAGEKIAETLRNADWRRLASFKTLKTLGYVAAFDMLGYAAVEISPMSADSVKSKPFFLEAPASLFRFSHIIWSLVESRFS